MKIMNTINESEIINKDFTPELNVELFVMRPWGL